MPALNSWGPILIGDDVLIGANAVVITNVPSNSIAVGVPAPCASSQAFDPGHTSGLAWCGDGRTAHVEHPKLYWQISQPYLEACPNDQSAQVVKKRWQEQII